MGSSSKRQKMCHVLVIPFPAQGHMNPMMQFSKILATHGLKVTLFATTTIQNTMQTQASNSVINFDYISYEFDKGDKPDGGRSYLNHIKFRVCQNLPGLIEKYKHDSSHIVLVYDSHMPWAGDIGHSLGVKVASFFTQAAASSTIYYHVHKKTLKIPLEDGLATVSLPSMPVMEINDLPSAIYYGLYPAALDLHANQFTNLHIVDWILFNTYYELEAEVVDWLVDQCPIKTVGQTIPSMYLDNQLANDKEYGLSLFKSDDSAYLKWLDNKNTSSVVYVSFGSFANLGQGHMDEVAWGLLSSNSNFLWVLRESEKGKLPSNFMAEAGERGLVVGWCSQLEVLAHKAVGCFMTHCGWNSTIEALSLGVPMLVMPQWSDQTTNAKYVVDVWKTGIRVKGRVNKGGLTKADVAECIQDVMEGIRGEELRKNALKWKELTIKAMDEGGSSDTNIREFISSVASST